MRVATLLYNCRAGKGVPGFVSAADGSDDSRRDRFPAADAHADVPYRSHSRGMHKS